MKIYVLSIVAPNADDNQPVCARRRRGCIECPWKSDREVRFAGVEARTFERETDDARTLSHREGGLREMEGRFGEGENTRRSHDRRVPLCRPCHDGVEHPSPSADVSVGRQQEEAPHDAQPGFRRQSEGACQARPTMCFWSCVVPVAAVRRRSTVWPRPGFGMSTTSSTAWRAMSSRIPKASFKARG
jgi:hypothetical protein